MLLPQLIVDQHNILYLRSSQNNYLLTWLSDQRNAPLVIPQYCSALGSPPIHTNTPLPPQVFHLKSNLCSETEPNCRHKILLETVLGSNVATAGDFSSFYY